MHEINLAPSELFHSDQQTPPTSRAEQALVAADSIGDVNASTLVRIVATAFDLTACEMFHHSRSRAPIAATRQLAMYMMHVVIGRSLTEVGRFFGRDRTTVSHACIRIEDLRDDLEFDEKINQIEEIYIQKIAATKLANLANFKSEKL